MTISTTSQKRFITLFKLKVRSKSAQMFGKPALANFKTSEVYPTPATS